MPSVPSHDRSLLQEAIDRAGIPAHRSALSSESILNPFSSFPPQSISSVLPLWQALTGRTLLCHSSAHAVCRPDRTTRVRHKEVVMTSIQKMLRVATVLGFALVGATVLWPGRALAENAPVTLPIETVANYIHAVIEADRDVYTRHVVERLQTKGVVVASENWEQKNTLPLPAQFLMESGRYIAKKGLGIQYRLISLWPINKRNVAGNELEKAGLGTILTQPNRPHTGFMKIGETRYFQAVYADLAATQACLGCHNAHPDSPKRDFKLNDVMGAIVITIPVGQ